MSKDLYRLWSITALIVIFSIMPHDSIKAGLSVVRQTSQLLIKTLTCPPLLFGADVLFQEGTWCCLVCKYLWPSPKSTCQDSYYLSLCGFWPWCLFSCTKQTVAMVTDFSITSNNGCLNWNCVVFSHWTRSKAIEQDYFQKRRTQCWNENRI